MCEFRYFLNYFGNNSFSIVALGIFAINEAVDSGDIGKTLSALRSPDVGLYGVIPECGETYQSDLAEAKKKKLAAGRLQRNKYVQLGT